MSTEEKVISIIAEQLQVSPGKVVSEAKLTDDLHADPLDMIELVMYLEEALNIEISGEDMDRWQTVKDIIDYCNAKKGG